MVAMETNIKLLTWFAVFVGVLSESHFYDLESQALLSVSSSYHAFNTRNSEGLRWRDGPQGSGQSPRVLCVVFVDPKKNSDPNCRDNALFIKETWGRHCDGLIFYAKKADNILPALAVPGAKDYGNLVHAFHMNKWDMLNRLNEYDWIFFARDDTYIVVENLKYHLSPHDPSQKIAWGLKLKHDDIEGWSPLYLALGYAVTTAAFPIITGSGGLDDCQKLPPDEMFSAACLQQGDVKVIDFRDPAGRHTFTNREVGFYLKIDPTKEELVQNADLQYPITRGPECCADFFVGASLGNPNERYTYDFMSHDFQFPGASCDQECPSVDLSGNSSDPQTSHKLPKYRILCLVNTTKDFHQTLAVDIKKTWGKRCTKLIFMSDAEDTSLPALNAAKGGSAWKKLKTSLLNSYSSGLKNIDWVVLAQHDGYVFFKNLVPLLDQYYPTEKLMFGCRLKYQKWKYGYVPFDCAVVLSKAAVVSFVKKALQIPFCKKETNHDISMKFSKCAHDAEIEFIDTRDCLDRHTFLPYGMDYFFLESLMSYEFGDFWQNNTFYPQSFIYLSPQNGVGLLFLITSTRNKYPLVSESGKKCCSRNVVAVSQLRDDQLYMYDFFETRFKVNSDGYPDSIMGTD